MAIIHGMTLRRGNVLTNDNGIPPICLSCCATPNTALTVDSQSRHVDCSHDCWSQGPRLIPAT